MSPSKFCLKKKKKKREIEGKETEKTFCFFSRAFNEVKATSRAHDKQVSLNTNKNYNMMQASKPWASSEDVATFNRGGGAPRGRGFRGHGGGRGGGRPGNDWNPRNNFNSGGSDSSSPQKQFNKGRGQFNSNPRFQRGNQQSNPNRGPQQGGNNNNNGPNNPGGFQQKPRSQNKGFRGGGN
jgi:hypothetical protein